MAETCGNCAWWAYGEATDTGHAPCRMPVHKAGDDLFPFLPVILWSPAKNVEGEVYTKGDHGCRAFAHPGEVWDV